MTLTGADFKRMRWSISALCCSFLVSAIALYVSGKYAEDAQNTLRAAQSQLNGARNRLDTAREDQKNMAIYSDEYRALLERKIFGDDHRLDWMEGLEGIRRQNVAIDFRYSISPQKNLVPQPAIDAGNFDIHYSDMKLQFELLHEGQLLNFFNTLNRQIKGKYLLDGCTLTRSAASNTGSAAVSHLKAECSGGWITLKNRNAPR